MTEQYDKSEVSLREIKDAINILQEEMADIRVSGEKRELLLKQMLDKLKDIDENLREISRRLEFIAHKPR